MKSINRKDDHLHFANRLGFRRAGFGVQGINDWSTSEGIHRSGRGLTLHH